MTRVGRHTFSSDSIPKFRGLVKRASGYPGAIGNIKGHAIDSIFMPLKGMNKVSSASIPYFTGSIVATSDKLVSIFIEATVCERKHMTF